MRRFEDSIEELKNQFFPRKFVDALIVIGSVANNTHSKKHSDLNIIFICKNISNNEKINSEVKNIGKKNKLTITAKIITSKDDTNIKKIFAEGRIVFNKKTFIFEKEKFGLSKFFIYTFTSDIPKIKTRLSQILYGKKSWYYKDKKKIIKEYQGIIDNKNIILLGKGCLMVNEESQKYILNTFDQLKVEYNLLKVVYE